MAEWARLTNTTIAKYIKGVQAELMAKQILLALLDKRGRVTYGVSGDGVKWDVEYREIPLTVNNGEQAITPQRQDAYKQPSLDIAGYLVSDVMTKREKVKNAKGPSQIVDYFKNMVTRSTRNLRRQFGEELYVDSGAAGNTGRLSGIETMMNATQTINVASGAARTANVLDPIDAPSSTYAGLSCALGEQRLQPAVDGISGSVPAGRR